MGNKRKIMETNILRKSLWKILSLLIVAMGAFVNSGCNQHSIGFALPPGDVEDGKSTFVELSCNTCHSVADIAYLGEEGKDLHFELGGEVTRVKSYGDLVTSIINPSHKIARDFKRTLEDKKVDSPMSNYNYIMTVQELVDVVTFLQKQYNVVRPESNYYKW